MISSFLTAFLPELVLLLGALGLFAASLGESRGRLARRVALIAAAAAVAGAAFSLGAHADLFSGAYRVDPFSQLLKLAFACGFGLVVVLLSGELPDIRPAIRSEYYLFLTLSVTGLMTLL